MASARVRSEPPLVVIVGPTASGKTGLAVRIAKEYNGEVISADSRAIYKDLTIDVKYSSAHKRKEGHSVHWSLRCTGDMDLIVAFLEREEGSELDEPIIAIIPKAVFQKEKIETHKNGKYKKLFINKNELIDVLDKYQSLKMAVGNI